MQNITIIYQGNTLEGTYCSNLINGRNGQHVSHTIKIPKNAISKGFFNGWRHDQSVTFECSPSGSGDYFLVQEDDQTYIFETK
ncbi:TPA: hypothetical protein ACKP0P_001567 [Serratia marcescens]